MRRTARELFHYGVVGLLLNAAIYLGFVVAVRIGAEPKVAMTVLYASGILAGYFLHRRVTFRSDRAHAQSAPRFLVAHGLGYLTNLLMLVILVDRAGYAPELVQFIAIFVVALQLFVTLKLFVFITARSEGHTG